MTESADDTPDGSIQHPLSGEQFSRLAGFGRRERVESGDILYATGDRSYELILLESAVVDGVMDESPAEPAERVYRRGPGEFLGELSLLTGQTVFLTAQVQQAGDIVRLDGPALRQVLAEEVGIADVLVETLVARREVMQRAAAGALALVGDLESAPGRALCTFASRLQLPHRALPADSEGGQRLIAAYDLRPSDLPAAVASGHVMRHASPRDVAEVIGLIYEPSGRDVDLVVIGAGPAGLAAAIYGASEGLETVLFDAFGPGGQSASSSRIENYPGFPRGVSGEELTRLALVQALKFGVQVYATGQVTGLDVTDVDGPRVLLADGVKLRCRAVIIAAGAEYRRLDVPGWSKFEATGDVRYSATSREAADCANSPVTVVGGANSAGQAALFLSARASRVDLVILERTVNESMSAYLVRRLESESNISVHTETEICELLGDERLAAVRIRDAEDNETELDSQALFCFIGADPATGWLDGVDRDEAGYILTAGDLPEPALAYQTNVRRVFAAGDVRHGSIKRVAAAVGEGAGAVASVNVMLADPPASTN